MITQEEHLGQTYCCFAMFCCVLNIAINDIANVLDIRITKGESQDCPPQDWPHGGQSWGGQSWALSVIRIAHLNYNTIFSLPAWFRVVTIDSGCFDMISTYLIQSASMFNWFIIRFIMDTQIHKKVQLNIFTHWVICLSSIQLWKGKWAGRGLLYKYIFSSVHPA